MLTLRFAAGFAGQLAPVLLVAYITTMFSADIRYGLQQAKLLSETDELTGLYNTRGFAIAANRLFGQAVRYGRAASLLMVDCDNLKPVNDSHGHEAGNRLLRQVANAVQSELRATDVPARYGGDEFIVLLPETPPKGAARRRRAHPQRDRRAPDRLRRPAHHRHGEHRHRLLPGGRPHASTRSPRAPTAPSTRRSRKAGTRSSYKPASGRSPNSKAAQPELGLRPRIPRAQAPSTRR